MKKIYTFFVSCFVLIALFFAFPSSVKAAIPFENARELSLDKTYFVKITNKTDYGIFKFTPTETAVYSFASSREDDADGYCELFDAAGNFLASHDDDYDCEFNLIYTLQAGQTYYFTPHTYDFDETNTSLNVKLTKTEYAISNVTDTKATLSENSITAGILLDKNGELFLDTDVSYDITGATMQLCFADGTTENYTCNGSQFVSAGDSSKVLEYDVDKNYQLYAAEIADKYEASLVLSDYWISIPLSVEYSPKVKSFTYTPQKENFSVEQTQKQSGVAVVTSADIVVTYMDGTQKTFSNYKNSGDPGWVFINTADANESYYLRWSENCDFSKVGTTSVQLGFIDKIETISVNVSENTSELQSFSFTPEKEIILLEASYYNTSDWYWEVGGTITVTKKDGSTETYKGNPDSGFKDAKNVFMPYDISYKYADSYEWKVGKNSYRFYLNHLSYAVPVTIVGVTNATFVPEKQVVLPHSDYYDCQEWFWDLDGTITLDFSDGTQGIYSGYANDGFYDDDNVKCPLGIDHNDHDADSWDVGADNYFNFQIGSFYCRVPVTITHDLESVSENSATCTTNGYTAYDYCRYCDYKTESTVLPATGHTDADDDHTCDVCGAAFAFNVKQPIDVNTVCKHSATFTTDTSEPDCTYQWYQGGSLLEGATDKTLTIENVTYDTHNENTYYCVVTNAKDESVMTSAAILSVSHDLTSETITKEPTCIHEGRKEVTCACGYKDTFDVEPLGHSYVTKDVVPATCTKEGYSGDEACEVCGRIKNGGSVLPVTEHSAVSAFNSVAPTCMAAGKESDVICEVCQKVLETGKEIPAKGHNFGENAPVCQICHAANPDYKEPSKAPTTEDDKKPVNTPTTQEKIDELAEKYGISTKTLALNEKTITNAKGNSDLAGAEYRKLKLKQKKTTKNSISISWSKVSGADGYIVYAGAYGTKLKKATTLSSKVTSYTHKNLKKNKHYKYLVVAYKDVDDRKVTLSASKMIFVTTKNGRYDNPKALKVAKTKLSVKKGKKTSIRVSQAKTTKKVKKLAAIRFESSNPKIATVSAKGVVKGIGKGSCNIYIYAQNGVTKTVKVTVK